MTSKHYKRTRNCREQIIKKYCNGDGAVINSFVIDKGHKKGLEVHSITDTGVIIIHNYYTGKLVTKLVARPQQIKRYYKNTEKEIPRWLLDLCKWHQDLEYNR